MNTDNTEPANNNQPNQPGKQNNPQQIGAAGAIATAGSNQPGNQDRQQQLLAEYNALRAEMLHRIGERYRIVAFSIPVFGVMLALDVDTRMLMLYPILGLFQALGWAQNDLRIGEIGVYIRKRTEIILDWMQWENYTHTTRGKESFSWNFRRSTVITACGIIGGTQLMAVIVPFMRNDVLEPFCIWLRIDLAVILVTMSIILFARKLAYR
jgi:hypothetical protein